MSSEHQDCAASTPAGIQSNDEIPPQPKEKKKKKHRRRRRRKTPSTHTEAPAPNVNGSACNETTNDASNVIHTKHSNPHAWKPTSIFRRRQLPGEKATQRRSSDTTPKDTEQLLRTRDGQLVRWLLNKLTPSNFDKLVAVFVSETAIHKHSSELDELLMRDAIETIISRAALDARYAAVHAKLCARLVKDLSIAGPEATTPEVKDNTRNHNSPQFLEMLCRISKEEIHVSTKSVTDQYTQGTQIAMTVKKRYVGSKRFVGELYNHNVLKTEQLTAFLLDLLSQSLGVGQDDDGPNVDELALEGLCVLVDTAGKALDEELALSSSLSASSEIAEDLERCWDFLKGLLLTGAPPMPKEEDTITNPQPLLSFRMRHMILDLLELRQLAWHPVRYGAKQRRDCVARALLTDPDQEQAGSGSKKKNRKRNKNKKQVHFGGTQEQPTN